ncbi:Fe-S cluster assembly protein SufD [Litoribrevibacter albus]|uniref:Fe-S cluster assembly protein SufD n=1 Tax=Litoribrevibacter albus TaxID=1473156 RepID=A0AA37W6H6_9GAMM|nr:Fe-S cluster assembly protein SufD [Litoribrevibacter albus]GLQ32037.1 Fe-S cluster assembly protein SufD [Litoribrevibacter albus]
MTEAVNQTFDYAAQAAQFAEQTSAPAWLDSLKAEGVKAFGEYAWPTRKTEHWKYTNLSALTKANFAQAAPANSADLSEAVAKPLFDIEGLDAAQLVFINGSFSSHLSTGIEELKALDSVEVVRFSEANEEQQQSITSHLGSITLNDQHMFSALNAGQLEDGVFVRFLKNKKTDKAIQVVHLTTAQDQAFSVNARLLVVSETGSQGVVVESFVSDDESQSALVNSLTECKLEDNAKLFHYRLQLEQEDIIHVGGMHVAQQASSQLESFHVGLGGKVKRVDIVVNHEGPGAHCDLKGVYLPQNNQHIDYHTCIEHKVPHCTTDEVFRGIIADQAKAVFNGRIHIHPDAQKTLAELNNRNLLLSNKAEINTKPELEIYADDVRCAHGATIAQLDEKAMSYMLSRGISRQEAEVMLSFGFINELLDDLAHHPIQEKLRPILAQLFDKERFGKDKSLTRHIV